MNLYSLQLWSESLDRRCRSIYPIEPLPQASDLDGDDRVLLARLRHEAVLAHSAIEGSRTSIIESWSLMSRCEIELTSRH